MTIENVLHTIHNVKKDDLLPLTKIQTEADLNEYNKSYYVPCTLSEWMKKFPEINPNYIYFLGGINFDVIYYDNDNLTYLHLVQLLLVTDEKAVNEMKSQVVDAIRRCKEDFNSEHPNYIHLLNSYSDGLRIDGLKRVFEKEGCSPAFYDTFISIYTHSDFTVGNLPKELILSLQKSKSEKQKKQTEDRIRSAFGDTESFLVYRGMTEKSTPAKDAVSWTPNINIAYRFASCYGKKPVVATAVVKKEDIIEYISSDTTIGGEEEFLVVPGKITIQQEKKLFTANSDEIIDNMNKTLSTFQTYKRKLKSLYQKYGRKSSCHDTLHSLRVLFLSLMLGVHEELSKSEMKQLAEASIYHDIGRVSDDANTTHGKKSADIYRKDSGYDKVVSFIVTYHCIDDATAKAALEKAFTPKSRDKVWKLYEILKDADALDRVRFGISVDSASDGLDIRYLRSDYSKRMLPLAIQTERLLQL